MRAFISYHRSDYEYRHNLEKILISNNIDYYAVPEDSDFNGKKAEAIKNFICNRLKQCDILICLIGKETYSRPHVDREIHTALKGNPGERLGIIGIILPTRKETLQSVDLNTFPTKLWNNKDYVVWSMWNSINSALDGLIQAAIANSFNKQMKTDHSNPCMPLRNKKYYDN